MKLLETMKIGRHICCLTGKEEWTPPAKGQDCVSKRHGHLTLPTVRELVYTKHMQWLPGTRRAARFVDMYPVAGEES
jgi:hypothetical protein